jgi:ADP-ribosyl-[dinitrogen reductase] hydrolase
MPLHPTSQTQYAIGALIGSAVGDALGAPFEFQPAGRYSARFPQPVRGGRGEMIGGGPWTAGEFTDDTHMALALAESLLAHGALGATDLWSRWRAWAATAKDVGILTRHALARAMHDGAAAHAHAANGGRSAGNGSLMRNTPVALFTLRKPLDSAVALAVAQSRLTHHDAANDEGVAIHTAMVRADCSDTSLSRSRRATRRADPRASTTSCPCTPPTSRARRRRRPIGRSSRSAAGGSCSRRG